MKRNLWLPATMLSAAGLLLGAPACFERASTCGEDGRCVYGELEGDSTYDEAPRAASCARDADCDDGNLCTADACRVGACAHVSASNGRVVRTEGCHATVCSGGEEHKEPIAAGSLCEGNRVCDAAGACVACGAAKACPGGYSCGQDGACRVNLGGDCGDDLACAAGHCVDGKCCKLNCAAECTTCDAAAGYAACALVPLGESHPSCAEGLACDGVGMCRALDGQACAAADECLSGDCVDGVCTTASDQ